jgi:predicted metal-dependent enzyme (double-stranded beta helix superfamily)
MTTDVTRLRDFVRDLDNLLDGPAQPEAALLPAASTALRRLLAVDDWLPEDFSRPDPARYQQYLLYGDPRERYSVVSFVWGPGQSTPVHDHTVWGLIGVLRGAELTQRYRRDGGRIVPEGAEQRCEVGAIEAVSPRIGDIHHVRNAYDDRTSISIHVYGGNIGRIRRHAFDRETGAEKDFVSGYASAVVPNLWAVAAPAS